MFDVSHYANALANLRVGCVELEPPSNRILVWKIIACEDLIDQRYLRTFARVLRREQTTSHEVYAHRFEVIGTHDVTQSGWVLAWCGRRFLLARSL